MTKSSSNVLIQQVMGEKFFKIRIVKLMKLKIKMQDRIPIKK